MVSFFLQLWDMFSRDVTGLKEIQILEFRFARNINVSFSD